VRIKEVRDLDVQVAIVIGGGNIWRGLSASHRGMDRTTRITWECWPRSSTRWRYGSTLDHMGVETRVQTAIDMRMWPNVYSRARHPPSGARPHRHFRSRNRKSVFFHGHNCGSAGKRNSRRCILKATKVDGVYDRDPKKIPGRAAIRAAHVLRSSFEAFADHGFDRVQAFAWTTRSPSSSSTCITRQHSRCSAGAQCRHARLRRRCIRRKKIQAT